MDKAKHHVSRRGYLFGLLSLGMTGVAGTTAGGTMAWFRDTDSSGNNIIETGTLELTFDSSGGMDLTKDLERDTSTSGSVKLVNAGSVSGSLDVDVKYSSDGSVNADELAHDLEVTTLRYGGQSIRGRINDDDNDGRDLEDFKYNDSGDNDLSNLKDPGGAGKKFEIELTRRNNSKNKFDGNSLDITFTFYLNQTDGM